MNFEWDSQTESKTREAFWAGDQNTVETALTAALGKYGSVKSVLLRVFNDFDSYASILCMRRQFASAEKLYRKMLSVSESSLGPNDANTIDLMERLAVVLRENSNPAEARELMFSAHTRALAIKSPGLIA